jgi:putative ATP-binding cassette transporter
MLGAFVRSRFGHRARWLFAILLLLLMAINALNVLNSFVGRDFMTALEERKISTFVEQALIYLGVFVLSTLADVSLRYTEETLALTWREWLSRWMVGRYLTPPVYQRLSDRLVAEGDIPNPDQRIAEDVRAFTATTLSFVILILNGTITIIAFSGVLWSISPALFIVTLLYAATGSLLAIARGRPLVRLTVAQLDREADFRSELIRVRDNAEALAVSRREDRLLARLLRSIDAFAANFRRIIVVNRNLGFFTTGYNYLIQIIPALIVGPLFIRGSVEFGVVTQSAMAFAQLVGAFSLVITQFQSISAYAAVVTRLGVLDEGIEQAQAHPVLASEVCSHHQVAAICPRCAEHPHPATVIEVLDSGTESAVAYEELTLQAASDGRLLLRDLNGSVLPGMRLLIAGPNEEAKTALFRATAGTWNAGSGRLRRPSDGRMLFLAEQPYFPPGTLREMLTSVDAESTFTDDQLLAMLHDLDLEPVLARSGGLDTERRWDTILSLGEQQKVAFAGLLLANPRIVFLERPGSALAKEEAARLINLLVARSMTLLVVGRPEEPRRSYTSVLELGGDGEWVWSG